MARRKTKSVKSPRVSVSYYKLATPRDLYGEFRRYCIGRYPTVGAGLHALMRSAIRKR